MAGGVFAAVGSIDALAGASRNWSMSWAVPAGTLALHLDALTAVFLLPVAVVGALGAVYGRAYQRHHAGGASTDRSLAAYNLLLLGMAVVVLAANLVLLLVAWELMTLASWTLVVNDHGERDVRRAGLRYLVASHVATAALMLLALLLATANGSFAVAPLVRGAATSASVLFLLALAGFGTKAGLVPFHVWLPDAHPAAPSHVSALMSAVMITMGFYGLCRFLPLLGEPALWWAYLLMVLGATGAVGGILFSIAQRDVKRALAYSTVEHAGVIALAMGAALFGTAVGNPAVAGLAWAALLLHIWNHALAKGLLFLGFGAVAQRIGSRDLDDMGGLLARWKLMGGVLVLGAAALAALPGLNVFTSEWLLFRALLSGATRTHGVDQVAMLAAVLALALAGAIAAAGSARLVALGVLGRPAAPGRPPRQRPRRR